MQVELSRGLKLSAVLREYIPDSTPNGFAIFMVVAQREGLAAGDLVDALDMPKSTISRNLKKLSDRFSPRQEGLDLIRLEHDNADYRVRRAFLTKRGKEFLAAITCALS
ncbi:MarR family winged helix-turn-helix transcriptional regulator [Vibrio cholerae]|uniref:MarR family transcriptional regulator n=1 Tax=Vibrio cholerae TaxID=666 RepID=A0A655XTW5_VIBCL|nr:MarR family winged helix-turn-helix transcriptional regulator [Vibrio cholerae]AFC58271.1 MarR family transcriptional regulator [Vibrio cholerae IEC224]AVL22651.1 Transcriptional regulator HosA [Vibrio cholerae]AWB73972.1 Transcriptional regulator HosA [Vibrio cholerae]MDV2324286.1 MarR family winged helix-turn-helix transcriptional regulator [Vibrio cholerae]CAB1239081.1 MarR family transcriptional regulator [Vibrio cholerae]